MGCDIHIHTEVKINGEWHHYSIPDVSRNYHLFAKMVGVRNYNNTIDPISPPKGIPQDATFLTKYDAEAWGIDGHSHSYLVPNEIQELNDFVKDDMDTNLFFLEGVFGYLFGNSWNLTTSPNDSRKDVEDFRFIFWFDN